MAKLPLDLKSFKKVASDGKMTTLRHDQGHEVRIAHAALSPKYREQLAALPLHKADGGDIQKDATINLNPNAEPPASMINPNPGSLAANYTPSNAEAPTNTPEPFQGLPGMPVAPQGGLPSPEAPPSPPEAPKGQPEASNSDPYGTQAQMDAFSKGAGEYKAGLAQEAAGQTAAAAHEAASLQNTIAAQKAAKQVYENHYNEIDNERKAFQADVANGHIDPSRYMNNMSTGQHIKTAIGLILGGIGSGITGGQNPVMQYLQSNIDRDIDAQKAELGKKENLLNANLRQFGNLRDATDMTRVMQNDMAANDLKKAMATAGGMEAKGKLAAAIGQFDVQNAGLIGQMAMRKSLLTGMQNGHVQPERVVMALVPEHERPAAYKELQTAQNLSKAKDNVLGAFDSLSQLDTVGNRASSPIQTPKQVNALKEPLLAQLVKDSEGRITPQDVPMIGALFPTYGDSPETASLKRNQLNKFISEKMNFPLLKSYGIDAQSFSRFNSQGASKFNERPAVQK